MIYIFGLLLLLFVFVSIVPFIQILASRCHMSEEIQYEFPQELFDSDMDSLRYEQKEGPNVSRISIQNRGSVRLARGNILFIENLEKRKEQAYSVELP